MKTTKMLAILILVLGLMVWLSGVSEAVPMMGTAFTYQGRLMDANGPADGLYDFEFKLWMDPCEIVYPPQVGDTLTMNDLDVIDGYFTVELDFNSPFAFNGYARWLEISVRPGDSIDVSDYVTLSPRQEVTPTPYSLYAENAGTDNDWMVSGDDMYSIPSGNVGIGTDSPTAKLHAVSSDNTVINSFAAGENNYSGFFGGGIGFGISGVGEEGAHLFMRGLIVNPWLDKYGTIDFVDISNSVKGSISSRTTLIGHVLQLGAGEDVQMCIYHNNRDIVPIVVGGLNGHSSSHSLRHL